MWIQTKRNSMIRTYAPTTKQKPVRRRTDNIVPVSYIHHTDRKHKNGLNFVLLPKWCFYYRSELKRRDQFTIHSPFRNSLARGKKEKIQIELGKIFSTTRGISALSVCGRTDWLSGYRKTAWFWTLTASDEGNASPVSQSPEVLHRAQPDRLLREAANSSRDGHRL